MHLCTITPTCPILAGIPKDSRKAAGSFKPLHISSGVCYSMLIPPSPASSKQMQNGCHDTGTESIENNLEAYIQTAEGIESIENNPGCNYPTSKSFMCAAAVA